MKTELQILAGCCDSTEYLWQRLPRQLSVLTLRDQAHHSHLASPNRCGTRSYGDAPGRNAVLPQNPEIPVDAVAEAKQLGVRIVEARIAGAQRLLARETDAVARQAAWRVPAASLTTVSNHQPAEVQVTLGPYPLAGQRLRVVRWRQVRGQVHWVVQLADGSRMLIPVAHTYRLGGGVSALQSEG